MNDCWSELARRARAGRKDSESAEFQMPFGFAESVLRRLQQAERPQPIEAWVPLLRPAVGLAFATALLCVLLQAKSDYEQPENLLVETENMIHMAVLK